MIKKLDLLIIKAFVGPFLATFLISLFVLVMQFFWLWIDDIVGKGFDFFTIMRLVSAVAATIVPLALPLSLLLSSIMTFGNLGESFELVAIKSAGISLLRFMRPLFIVAVLISGVAFLFENNIIPYANLKLDALKWDMVATKPAFDIKEGQFYDKLEGYVIKLGKKDKDDSTIRDVIIYERNFGLQDNLMTAQSGVMRVTPDKRFIEFKLRNGWRYEEQGNRYDPNTQFIRVGFKEYKKLFDLSSFTMNKTEDSLFRYSPKMLSVRQLDIAIDSLGNVDSFFYARSERELRGALSFVRYRDSAWQTKPLKDSNVASFEAMIPTINKIVVYDRALSQVNNAKSNISLLASDYKDRENSLRSHWIEWNRKFTLSVACLVLFVIGAPLGSIIRKGGLGTPLLFAIIFFVLFHLLNTFGEKAAKSGAVNVFSGMWLSTVVLIPIGIFLTVKAMHDSQLFNKEVYYRLFKKLRHLFTTSLPAKK
ncbi:YjgP/YjgQ family permease [Ilyomonas limi]|uniref:YjgP/YjgQ family permease n=1 Tax=Ilyomonas limi TaxID=2575867 RepID=A0A4U3KR81_9BACT|nr:LptF/LptG family permease [Ilyomonas limi]TKK64915.1 YjgP/YjgQ family permease [Ilyomonas limi]